MSGADCGFTSVADDDSIDDGQEIVTVVPSNSEEENGDENVAGAKAADVSVVKLSDSDDVVAMDPAPIPISSESSVEKVTFKVGDDDTSASPEVVGERKGAKTGAKRKRSPKKSRAKKTKKEGEISRHCLFFFLIISRDVG